MCESDNSNLNTVLLIMNLVFTAVSTTMLGIRCKLWRSKKGCMASCRPKGSSPSPMDKTPKELTQVVVIKS